MPSADACTRCGWQPKPRALWPTHGELGCDWIETFCILGEGDSYGKPFRLYDDQARFLYEWYEHCPKCGQWRYCDAVWGAATGSGKTQFDAGIAALEFAGPPEIAPRSPNIVVAAASYDQAGLLFGQCGIMLGGRDNEVTEAPLCGYFYVYENKISFTDARPGQIIRVAAIAGTNEGGQPTLFLADELHEWGERDSKTGRLHAVIAKSTTKRSMKCVVDGTEVDRGRGRVINLSTAGFDVDHSLLGDMYTHGQQARFSPASAPRLLFRWREAREGLDYDDPEQRAVACRDGSGAADILWSVADRVAEWDKPQVSRSTWIRYYANRWVELAEESWLKDHPGAWGACKGRWTLEGDEPAVMAIDMALRRDSVSVRTLWRLGDSRVATVNKTWYPADGKIDHLEVFDYIRQTALNLGGQFRGLVYDPRFFELPARQLEEEGLLVIEFDQSPARMAPACGLAYDMIVHGQIVHAGDPDEARQVKAAVRREQERGFTLSKSKSRVHIDAAVTLCMGVAALAQLEEKPDPMKLFW